VVNRPAPARRPRHAAGVDLAGTRDYFHRY